MIDGLQIRRQVIAEIGKAVIGKEDIITKTLASILAGGHILFEDIPGVGKTTMAMAISKTLSLKYNRLQFTPDVMPSDVVGYSLYNKEKGVMEYKKGVIVCNLFLADEINRTSSKTQSALLEAMEEGKVTIEGKSIVLPSPFIVIATQNPTGSAGTTLLPDSQLDRFMVRLSMGYPSKKDEVIMLKNKSGGSDALTDIKKVLSGEDIVNLQKAITEIFVHDAVYEYIVEIVNATRNNDLIELGISPRGTVALINMAKAMAFLNGRNYVVPEDVQKVYLSVSAHRVILSSKAKISRTNVESVLRNIINHINITGV
ncbi:MAG: MoxR family ATPase [Lachnospiraceae bacterium]|nr:MoxR family ATPase [Lachnospiraceae bacterium]